jgi:hypothetical protein
MPDVTPALHKWVRGAIVEHEDSAVRLDDDVLRSGKRPGESLTWIAEVLNGFSLSSGAIHAD